MSDPFKNLDFGTWESKTARSLLRQAHGDDYLNIICPLVPEDYIPPSSLPLLDVAKRWDIEPKTMRGWVIEGKIDVLPGWLARKKKLHPEVEGAETHTYIYLKLFVQESIVLEIESKHKTLSSAAERYYDAHRSKRAIVIVDECSKAREQMCYLRRIGQTNLLLNCEKTCCEVTREGIIHYKETEASPLIAELEKKVAALEEQLAAAKEAQPAAAPPLTPQQKAAIVRGENTLNAWKPAISAMIKVAVRCGEEGRKLRQRPDFYAMFNELDVPLNGEQERFFRKSMPDEHIDRLGDARGKADPSDNV